MINFDYKTLKFTFKEEECEIEYPTIKMISDFRKEIISGKDEIEATIDFICKLGAKREIVESLRASQLNTLVEELTQESSSKKN